MTGCDGYIMNDTSIVSGGVFDNQLRYVDENNWLFGGVEPRMRFTAFTSPGAKAPPPSKGDLSGCSSGEGSARTSPESKSEFRTRRLFVTCYLRHSLESPPLKGVAQSDGGCIFLARYLHLSLPSNRKIKNQLATMATSGVTSSFTYDPWGRLASRSATINGQSYTATYTYRFGDKLQRIDSNFPGETAVVLYNYDGLGKRRLKAIGNDTTYWRWDVGYSVLAQYQDTTPDWGISGFDRFFVPFGHTALAEADLDASGVPANAAYTYLAHDHLGTSTHGFNQSKTVVSQNVHLPFGQRSYAYGNSPYHEFTGKPWDAESQMYYFPYRYYSPSMNRWTSPDPAGLVDGPNVYEYVRGNPLSYIDTDGLEPTTTVLIIAFIIGMLWMACNAKQACDNGTDLTEGILERYRDPESGPNSDIRDLASDEHFYKTMVGCPCGSTDGGNKPSSNFIWSIYAGLILYLIDLIRRGQRQMMKRGNV